MCKRRHEGMQHVPCCTVMCDEAREAESRSKLGFRADYQVEHKIGQNLSNSKAFRYLLRNLV